MVEFTKRWGDILDPYKNRVNNYLEIGLYKGTSLKVWKDHFNCNAYGIDISLDDIEIDKDIHNIYCMDATDENSANAAFNNIKFDYITDDSCPNNHYKIFTIFSKFLEENSIYIIETFKSKFVFYSDLNRLTKNFPNFRFEVIHSRNSGEPAIACYKLS